MNYKKNSPTEKLALALWLQRWPESNTSEFNQIPKWNRDQYMRQAETVEQILKIKNIVLTTKKYEREID